ncbi:MAG: OadG family protein [Candidatus Amulumruptor caecigallinarius]|nr:OadG family protein [Candidatus Amulumruptor caecigallinarius]
MVKKHILSATLCIALLAGVPTSAAAACNPAQEYTEVSQQGDQTNVEGDWTPSDEVNTVQESEMTRKAIQAEKAKNAAENDRFGGAITIIAMCIVLAALIILSILFLGFGKISSKVQKNKKREAHGVNADEAEDHHDELDSGEVIAAISMALAEHMGQGHDMEDTILTIRRMRKAYSPWNSKIYNMRVIPEHTAASTTRRHLK